MDDELRLHTADSCASRSVVDSCGWCWGMKYWRRWRCTAPPACRCIACVYGSKGVHAMGPWTKADSCGGLFCRASLEYFPVGFFRMICCRHRDASMRQDIIQNFGALFSFQIKYVFNMMKGAIYSTMFFYQEGSIYSDLMLLWLLTKIFL